MKGVGISSNILLLLQLICFGFLISSCSTGKYLGEDESLLKKNKLKLETQLNQEAEDALRFELSTFYRQKPNSTFMFLFPREWYYFVNEGDSSWYNNWARNSLGEKPSIFLESESYKTAESMQNYLRNKKGFYNAEVDYSVSTQNKKTTVKYEVDTKEQYTIASIDYIGEDEPLVSLVKSLSGDSKLKEGTPIDALAFDIEKGRITTELQNLGYANFVPNYINIIGDSTNYDHAIDILIEIRNPGVDQKHKKYVVGDVNVFTDYYQGQNREDLISKEMHGLIFKRASKNYSVRPSRLNERIFIKSGDLYRKDKQNKSFRKLSTLEPFRFINISPSLSAKSDSIIDINIFLTPYNKRWVSDTGVNLFYSSISASGRRLFGFSLDAALKNRNMFGGAELFSVNGELGYEFDFSPVVRTSAITGNLQANLEIPKVIDPIRGIFLLNKLGIISDKNNKLFRSESTTKMSLGYNQTNIIDFYNLRSVSASFGYDFRPNARNTFVFKTTGINFNDFQLKQNFLNNIQNNPLILNSFESNLFTGFLFNSLTHLYSSKKKPNGFSWAQISNFEISGWELLLANEIIDPNQQWKFNNFDYAQFIKFEFDTRLYKDLTAGSSLAFRFNTGLAIPLREDQAVPFNRQFYVGGPNSIRAWQLRELGPGSHSDLLLNPIDKQLFYQQGDIKLEANLEYRFDIFWLIEGAFFFDAGNVWTRRFDDTRLGAKFSGDFYKEIAVGTGWGIRWDLNYFLIRFDFGYRLRNPFPDPVHGNYWQPLSNFKFLGNVNVAINYPF